MGFEEIKKEQLPKSLEELLEKEAEEINKQGSRLAKAT